MKDKSKYRIKEENGKFIIEVYDYFIETVKDGWFKSHEKKVYEWFVCYNNGRKEQVSVINLSIMRWNKPLPKYNNIELAKQKIIEMTTPQTIEDYKINYYNADGEKMTIIPEVNIDELV